MASQEENCATQNSDSANGAMDDKPLVSIITPTLNGFKYLEMCIQSVLNQSYPHIEHVFVDGGSADGTVDILLRYQSSHPARVRFVSAPGTNACSAWNRGWEIAKGDIFGFLGADDLLTPDAILTVVNFFKAKPEASFLYGNCNYIDKDGKFIRKHSVRNFDLYEAINHEHYVPTTSAYYRRELVQHTGYLDTSVNICDFDYLLRSARNFRIYRIDETLSDFRMHDGGITGSKGHIIYAREAFIISKHYGARFLSFRRLTYYVVSVCEFLRDYILDARWYYNQVNYRHGYR